MKTLLAISLVIGAGVLSWELVKMSSKKSKTRQTNKYGDEQRKNNSTL